jgi:glycosyltransferase involved in cell wall biosynthesis
MDLSASKRPDVVFANSKTTAARVERFYGRKVDRVIYPPVKTSQFSGVPRLGDDEGYLMWGRLVEYKRADLAIEAARHLGFKLNVVGIGPQEAALKSLAAGLANVVFHGRLPDEQLRGLMSRSRAVLFPAYEDFGIVPVEAMAAGLPVIAYGEGGAGESVTDETGVLLREQSATALVEAIERLEKSEFDDSKLRQRAALFDEAVFRREYKAAVTAAIERRLG